MAGPTPDWIRLHQTAREPLREADHAGMPADELAHVLTALPALVLVADRSRTIVACSGQSGLASNLIGRDLLATVPPEQRDFYALQLRRVLEGGETVVFDVANALEHTPPQRFQSRIRLAPLAIRDEIRGIIWLHSEIDDELLLPHRPKRIQATLDHVDEGMLVVDPNTGSVLECNATAANLLGLRPEELRDTAPSWLQLAPEGEARLGWSALVDELVAGRVLRGRAILREGHELSVEFRGTSRDVDGDAFAFLRCRDISAELARERATANQERLATVGSLAAGVAHEINNPLAYVIANVQYALDAINHWQRGEVDSTSDPERTRAQIKEALHEANEGARRVQRIVADLKALARQGEERVEPVDVERVLQWAIGVTMAEIRHRARLSKQLEPLPLVRGDEARLGQVFVNILLNAAQAIEPGSPFDNEVIVNAYPRDGRVFVEILDTGTGIPEEDLKRIFDPFFTTKPRGIGTGLGLSICHEIVASMKGVLTAENRPLKGAKFMVEFPALPASHTSSRPPPRSSQPPERRGVRVLVIDDEPLAAKALARVLREHSVTVADHAPTGLRLACENHFDVIFCDLMMPELNGMAVHDKLASHNPRAAERVVFVTGGTFSDEARSFANRHANRCLFKPFDAALVKSAIDSILSKQEADSGQAC